VRLQPGERHHSDRERPDDGQQDAQHRGPFRGQEHDRHHRAEGQAVADLGPGRLNAGREPDREQDDPNAPKPGLVRAWPAIQLGQRPVRRPTHRSLRPVTSQ